MVNHSLLLDLGIKKRNKQIDTSWQELADQYSEGLFSTGEAYRCWVKTRMRDKNQTKQKQAPLPEAASLPNYKEEVEIRKDGSQSSNKLLRMSIDESKDAEFLLKAHGYDTNKWELISAKNNIWNSYSKQDGIMTLYSSKISVKPITNGLSLEKLLEAIKEVPPVYIPRADVSQGERLLEIPFFDSHFGVSDFDYYKPTQDDTMDLINSKPWNEILFIIGQDMFHNDNFRGSTSSNTPIEKVDTPDAWRDATRFYYPLIEAALKQSRHVKIVYSKGNHDETLSWAFVQLLKQRYPQAEFDDAFVERKIHTYGKVFIGITHGDKAKRNLHNLFPTEFPLQWAQATTREIHTGHLHVEDSRDWFGMMVRTLCTRNRTDSWHKDNGFVGAHKRFMLFEYDETNLKSIYYV